MNQTEANKPTFNARGFNNKVSLALSSIEQLASYIVPDMTAEDLRVVKRAEHEIITILRSLPINLAELKQFYIAKDATKLLEVEVRDFLLSGKSTFDAVIRFNTNYDLVNRVCREMREAASVYVKTNPSPVTEDVTRTTDNA